MKIGDVFRGKFLKASDVAEGGELVLTIGRIVVEEMEQTGEEKAVAYFQETKQGLVLNRTNADEMAKLFGTDEMSDWAGRKISLYRTTTRYAGKLVDCLRIRDAQESPF